MLQHAVLEQHCKAEGAPCVPVIRHSSGVAVTAVRVVFLGVFATDVEASVFYGGVGL